MNRSSFQSAQSKDQRNIFITGSDGTMPIFFSIPVPIPTKNFDSDANFDFDSYNLKFTLFL